MFSSFGGGGSKGSKPSSSGTSMTSILPLNASNKKQTPQEEYAQRRQAAQLIIKESRVKIQKELELYKKLASNTYYMYGYMAGVSVSSLAVMLVLTARRFEAFRAYATLAALGIGYFGGSYLHAFHAQYLLETGVVGAIDENMKEMQKLNIEWNQSPTNQTKGGKNNSLVATIPDFADEEHNLIKMRKDVFPRGSTGPRRSTTTTTTTTTGSGVDNSTTSDSAAAGLPSTLFDRLKSIVWDQGGNMGQHNHDQQQGEAEEAESISIQKQIDGRAAEVLARYEKQFQAAPKNQK